MLFFLNKLIKSSEPVCPSESCPLYSTTFPHVLPLLALLERSAAVGEGAEPWEMAEVGVDVVMFHLGAARTMAQLGGVYRSNAEARLQGERENRKQFILFKSPVFTHLNADPLIFVRSTQILLLKCGFSGFQEQAAIREILLTEFQMRLLWGSRGAEQNRALRFSKFEQVLTALSNRLEPPLRRP